jgi:hypothetical protein
MQSELDLSFLQLQTCCPANKEYVRKIELIIRGLLSGNPAQVVWIL